MESLTSDKQALQPEAVPVAPTALALALTDEGRRHTDGSSLRP